MKHLLIAAAVAALLPAAALAQTASKKMENCPVPVAGTKVVVCPITGEKFTPDASTLSSTYKGKTYQYCCPGCKGTFDKNPAKYAVADKPVAKKAAPAAKKVAKKA